MDAGSEALLHPLFLPYTAHDLLSHFVPSERDHLAAWRKRIRDAGERPEDPAYLHRGETLWTAGALLAIHRHPHRRERWHRTLVRAFGSAPPLDEPVSWDAFLDGQLELYFEVGLSSPEPYRKWLSERLTERHPLAPQVELGRTRRLALERHTQLDALLLNTTHGFAVHFEAKVLSDIDAKTTFDALRNQLARNLDAMDAPPPASGPLTARRPDRSLLALLTPELFRAQPSSRLYGQLYGEYRSDATTLQRDLPHLDPGVAASLARRLGWLTFEDLVREDDAACLWLGDPEDPVSQAVWEAARRLEARDRAGGAVRERQLQESLAVELDGAEVERRVDVPGWDPQPGATDVVVRESGRLTRVIETKLKAGNDIYECLWDLAKVSSIATGPTAPAAYLVVGTTRAGWGRHATRELFESGRQPLVGTIRAHLDWWVKYILGDSAGRPAEVPEEVDMRILARVPFALGPVEWELRAVRVLPRDPWTPFASGLPAEPPR